MEYRGLAAPTTKANGGYFAPAYLEELLWSSLLLIMMTSQGSMPGRRNFGNNIANMIFEQVSFFSLGELQAQIRQIIEKNDPRIIVNNVRIIRKRDTIYIQLSIGNKIDRRVYEKTFSLDMFG